MSFAGLFNLNQPVSTSNPLPVAVQGNVQLGTAVEITNDVGNSIPVTGAQLDGATFASSGGLVISGVTAGGIVQHIETNASGHVNVADGGGSLTVDIPGVSATGTLTALNTTVSLALTGATGFAVDLRGTFVATTVIEGTVDGANWITLSVLPIGAGLNIAQVASATAAGAWWGNANGLQQIRARASAYTSGTVTVTLRAMQSAGKLGDHHDIPAPKCKRHHGQNTVAHRFSAHHRCRREHLPSAC